MHQPYCCLRLPKGHHARLASTSAGPYPFPTHTRPTPHQIFHLPVGASQPDIKARYYELVRVHHPDAPYGRDLSPAIRRSRFQAITAAYDTLRGKRGSGADGPVDIYREEILRRKRAWAAHEEARRRSGHPWEDQQGQKWKASADDRWKDRIILIIGIMALGAGLGPVFVLPSYSASRQAHLSASRNLAQARSEAQEFGEEQRREISKRVKAFKEQQAQERSAGKGSSSVSSAS